MIFRALLIGTLLALGGLGAQAAPGEKPPVAEPESPADWLDGLYKRLAAAKDPQGAAQIAAMIGRERLKSGSDTADLLMARAIAAGVGKNEAASAEILDKLMLIRPEWAEIYARRAALRLEGGDIDGAMRDFAQTLKRDPRNLDALGALAQVLASQHKLDEAEGVYRSALALAPGLQELVEGERRVKAMISAGSL